MFPKQRVEGLSYRRLEAAGLRRFEHLPPGYTLERADLGGGSFAKVFLVRNDSTGDLQALKRVDRSRAARQFDMGEAQVSSMIEQEFWHMQRTTHPHIIKLFDFFQDAKYAYYVMEAVNGGTLKELAENTYGKAGKGEPRGAQKLSEAYVAEILQQAAYALHHLHEDCRIHMDVKLENLMLLAPDGPPHLVLIDLGIVESVKGCGIVPASAGAPAEAPRLGGTPATMAPEMIDGYLEVHSGGFDGKVDVFSLGVVAHELLTGRPPYSPARVGGGDYGPVDYGATRRRQDALDLAELRASGCSAGALGLLEGMLEVDPARRLSFRECLSNEWLQKSCERSRTRRLRAAGRHSLGGAPTSPEVEEAAGEELSWRQMRRICKCLERFSRRSELHRAVAYHLAAYLPVKQLRRASEKFRQMDVDFSGVVPVGELSSNLSEVLGLSQDGADEVAGAADLDSSGAVDFQEFAAAVTTFAGEKEQRLLDILFDRMSLSRSEDLTFAQAHAAVETIIGSGVPQMEVARWLSEASGLRKLEVGDQIPSVVFRRLLELDDIPAVDMPPSFSDVPLY
jgi:serine/threonine protein kinase